jgi:hypothetical protein
MQAPLKEGSRGSTNDPPRTKTKPPPQGQVKDVQKRNPDSRDFKKKKVHMSLNDNQQRKMAANGHNEATKPITR